jgi:hypothetical protein
MALPDSIDSDSAAKDQYMRNLFTVTFLISTFLITLGCNKPASTPPTPEQWQSKPVLESQMQESVKYFRLRDPTIRRFFDDSYGLAAFSIYKAPSSGGGAFGRGQVYEMGNMVGTASISQETVGFSIPSDYFREIIFFKDKADFNNFKANGLIFDSQAIGIALSEGVAAKSKYTNGIAVFVMTDTGPMADAPLAGQKFIYAPTTQ